MSRFYKVIWDDLKREGFSRMQEKKSKRFLRKATSYWRSIFDLVIPQSIGLNDFWKDLRIFEHSFKDGIYKEMRHQENYMMTPFDREISDAHLGDFPVAVGSLWERCEHILRADVQWRSQTAFFSTIVVWWKQIKQIFRFLIFNVTSFSFYCFLFIFLILMSVRMVIFSDI